MDKISRASRKKMYGEFAEQFDFCWACGLRPRVPFMRCRPKMSGYLRVLEIHHILRGVSRVHDRRAIVRLCRLCHDLAGGADIRENGKLLPNLAVRHAVWLKRVFDPDFYDLEYLDGIAAGECDRPAVPPVEFVDLLLARGRILEDELWLKENG